MEKLHSGAACTHKVSCVAKKRVMSCVFPSPIAVELSRDEQRFVRHWSMRCKYSTRNCCLVLGMAFTLL